MPMDSEKKLSPAETDKTQTHKQQADGTNTIPAHRRENGRSWPFGYLLLWVITVFSLLLNAITLHQVVIARQVARQAIADAIAVLDGFQDQSFSHTLVVDETLLIDTDLPIDERIPVSIDETMPINTTVTVNANAGPLGTIPIHLPISTTVPVDLDFEVPIDQSFHVTAAVPVYFEVPVALTVSQTPLHDTLDDVTARLELLIQRLDQPLVPLPFTQVEPETVPGE
jgi:hypothetical protein